MSLWVLLIGNYPADQQPSMQRYASLLLRYAGGAGVEVDLMTPRPILSCLTRRGSEIAKWLGHADKFLLFPLVLLFRSRRYDVVHICDHGNAPYLYVLSTRPTVVTCHDCLAIRAGRGEFAAVRVRWTGRMAQRVILAALRRARHVICVSEATRCDFARLSGRSDASLIPNVLCHPFRRIARNEAVAHLQRLGIAPSRFFVHVGGNDWYKNRAGALKIFRELLRHREFKDRRFLLVGPPLAEEHGEGAGPDLSERLIVRQGLSDEDLCAIYTLAEALLFPSLQEGFGWPIIEAQACGCLVVTSCREPMISVAGGAAILIDPSDPRQAAREIASRWRDREDLVSRGYDNLRRYDPQEFASAYAQVYRDVASSCRRNYLA